eukprot:4957799-Ditylum_brightwellii.AAC.1
MIELSTSGLRNSSQRRVAPQRYEVATALFDDTINAFSPMAFAANQQQSKMYTYKDMLQQPDHKKFITAMMDEIALHEDRNHWSLIKQPEVSESRLVHGK